MAVHADKGRGFYALQRWTECIFSVQHEKNKNCNVWWTPYPPPPFLTNGTKCLCVRTNGTYWTFLSLCYAAHYRVVLVFQNPSHNITLSASHVLPRTNFPYFVADPFLQFRMYPRRIDAHQKGPFCSSWLACEAGVSIRGPWKRTVLQQRLLERHISPTLFSTYLHKAFLPIEFANMHWLPTIRFTNTHVWKVFDYFEFVKRPSCSSTSNLPRKKNRLGSGAFSQFFTRRLCCGSCCCTTDQG